jgi:SAM-dependent methyltransferase
VTRLESDYYTYMGYDSDRAREALSHYLQFFPEGPVLELACGRGEFLDVLRAAGIPAHGVDLDEGMVQRAVERGHDVVLGDAVSYLEQVEEQSLGGVFCAHFLEHLQPADVDRTYRAAARALRPGGRFVAAVPSAASLSVLGYDFWRDPTHVRFYDPMLLAFFAGQAGLSVLDSGGNPRNDPGPPPSLTPVDFQPVASLSSSVAELLGAAEKVTPPQLPPQHRRIRADAASPTARRRPRSRTRGRTSGRTRRTSSRCSTSGCRPCSTSWPSCTGRTVRCWHSSTRRARCTWWRSRRAVRTRSDRSAGHGRRGQLQRRPPALPVPGRACAGRTCRPARSRPWWSTTPPGTGRSSLLARDFPEVG